MSFFRSEAASGVVLLMAAVVAVLIANSGLHETYLSILAMPFGPLTVGAWINDGLMAFFFFVVGLEIKAELKDGALSTRDRALLPAVGALGGMVVPALIYLCFQRDRGWGIPMATDIAFAVGVLSLFRVSPPLKIFLLALAIVDDLGAVLVIAIFYTASLQWVWLLAAVGCGAAAYFSQRRWYFLIFAVGTWWLVHLSGVHATIAGCALGLLIREPRRLCERLHGWSAFIVMPIFALANAGVVIGDVFQSTPIINGVSLGLLIGKPVGILAACWIAVKTGAARIDFSWRALAGVACLGGIGFTMSVFIAGLAFPDTETLELAKLGIIRGSLLSALLGTLVLSIGKATRRS